MDRGEADGQAKKRRMGVFEKVLIAVIVVCLLVVGAIGLQYLVQSQSYSRLADEVVQFDEEDLADGGELAHLTLDWDALRAECPDIVGWVTVPDTVISYPIVQGPDNEYYLHRSYDGTTSWASTGGTIFLDATNAADFSNSNNVLYGHHMNDGSMFAEIASWAGQEAFDEHRTVYVLTPTMNYRLRTFAAVRASGSEAIVQTAFGTAEDFAAYVGDKVSRSSVTVDDVDLDNIGFSKMFMLVTCEYTQNDGRECICALVSEQAVPVSQG